MSGSDNSQFQGQVGFGGGSSFGSSYEGPGMHGGPRGHHEHGVGGHQGGRGGNIQQQLRGQPSLYADTATNFYTGGFPGQGVGVQMQGSKARSGSEAFAALAQQAQLYANASQPFFNGGQQGPF